MDVEKFIIFPCNNANHLHQDLYSAVIALILQKGMKLCRVFKI